MPVLKTIRERFEKEEPLTGLTVAACLHVTAETANLMQCAPGRWSQRGAVRVESALDPGRCGGGPGGRRDPRFRDPGRGSTTATTRISRPCSTWTPDITMDDGADLATLLHTKRTELNPIGSTEETTTGVIRLRAMAADGTLRLPVVAVNDSDTKHLFDNHYGTGQSAMDGIIRATNMLMAGATVAVIGYGNCGRGVALERRGWEPRWSWSRSTRCGRCRRRWTVIRCLPPTTPPGCADVFVTVTGNKHVLRRQHFDVMKDGAIVANAGHFDVEIDLEVLGEMARDRRPVRNNLEEYELADGRRILVVAEGRLVNLGAAEGHPADVMDMSFANQAMAAEWLAQRAGQLEPGIYTLPVELDQEVARIKLDAMGAGLEELTDEQKAYLSGWREGT